MAAHDPQPATTDAAKRAKDYAEVRDWPGYFGQMLGTPARETLIEALDRFDADGGPPPNPVAVDLGCGEGRDTLELLRRGWRVVAIDGHPQAFELLVPRVEPEWEGRLETRFCDFSEAQIPPCDLLNASFSLPFCEPADFPGLWEKIVAAIRPRGRFCGQLFGDRDDWARLPDRSHQTRARVENLLAMFHVEHLVEDEKVEKPTTPNPKHWHVYHIVARRKEAEPT